MKREPAIAAALLKLFCSDSQYDSVTGDLLEQYQAGRGSVWYFRQTLDVVCLSLYSRVFRRPLVRKDRMPIGQGLGLVFVFAMLSAAFVSLASALLLAVLAIVFGGIFGSLYIAGHPSETPIAESPRVHPGINTQRIPVEGAVGLLFVIATFLIFFLGIGAVREILVVTVPIGILGGGLLLQWHKNHPVKFQGLGLRKKK
jgi:hypothetical protein